MAGCATSRDTLAYWIDSEYDVTNASDRKSRYGAYLRDNRGRFFDDREPTAEPLVFAQHAFTVASTPIMSPGYVHRNGRILDAAWTWDDDYRLALDIDLASPLPPAVANATRDFRWGSWEREGKQYWRPFGNDRPAVFATTTVRVPMDPTALPEPVYRRADPDVATAKAAVRAVCAQVNDLVSPLLAAFEQDEVRRGR